MPSNKEMPSDRFCPMNFSMEIPSLFKAAATETHEEKESMTSDVLNEENRAIGVKSTSLKLKRYADIIKSDMFHKEEFTPVLEPTSPRDFALNSIDTISDTGKYDPDVNNCTDNAENSSSDGLKLEGSSQLDKAEVDFPHQILSQDSESDVKEMNQSPLKPRLWFEDSSEMFDAIDSSFSTNGDCSNNSSFTGSADISSSSTSGDSSFTKSPETKKAGFLRRLGARLLKKHKKKRTISDELNKSQQSSDTSSRTDDTSSTTCEGNFNTLSEQSQVVTGLNDTSETTETSKANTAETPSKSVPSSNDISPTAIKSEDQDEESVMEEARLPIEAISPAGKRDHVRAEKRLRVYFASKKLAMPGSSVPKNRISWKNANEENNTSPTVTKEPPNRFGTKKVPYRPKLTEDDRTTQSIEKYWNYRIALFTKITSSSLKCLPEEEDIPSNKPEVDYVEMGLTGFAKNQFERDTHEDSQPNNLSDTASDEFTKTSDTLSSFAGKTDPETVVSEAFENKSQIAADSSPFIRGEVASSNEAPPQISQLRPEEIGAAIIRIKAFLANKNLIERNELTSINDDVMILADSDFQNEIGTGSLIAPFSTSTTSLSRNELDTAASCSSVCTFTSEVAEMREEDAGASSLCRPSTSTVNSLESPSRSTILSQISPSEYDGIEAARMRMKDSLATISGSRKTLVSAENSSDHPTGAFPLFRSELISGVPHSSLNTSTSQTTPVERNNANTPKKLMKKSSVMTSLKKKKEVYTPPKSRFSKYLTTTRKGYKLTTQLLKDVFQKKDQNEPMEISMPVPSMPTPTHPTLLGQTCSNSLKNPNNLLPLKVGNGQMNNLIKPIPQKYKVGFGPKKLALLALMKLAEERSSQKKSKSYWSVREDFRDSMTSRKVKHRKNREDPYIVTESIPLESVLEEFDPTDVMIISPGKSASPIIGSKRVVKNTDVDTQARSDRVNKLLDAHLEDTLAKMKLIQMTLPFELPASCAVESTPTAVYGSDNTNCSSKVTSSFQFNPMESDDIEGAKEPVCSPNVANAECDTMAFGYDVKIEHVAVPVDSPADATSDQITSNLSKESDVNNKARCSDNSFNNATSLQISPAKEDEIEAARKRMEAYLAERGSQLKTSIKIASPDMNQINQAQPDILTGVNKDVPVKASTAAPTTIACKMNLQTTVSDGLDNTSSDTICGQLSPAKENEIEAARIRMEAYLTKKGGLKKPVIDIGNSSGKAQIVAANLAKLTEASKCDSSLDATANPFKNVVYGQISPAKSDEIEAARIRMEVYLAKKNGPKVTLESAIQSSNNSQITSTSTDVVTGAVDDATCTHSTNSVDSLRNSFKDTISCQISPAKSEEIEAARIRMEAYLAKKSGLTNPSPIAMQSTNATTKCGSQTDESVSRNAPVKQTKLVASLSEGNPMLSKPQKPDVILADTPRLTPFVIIKLSEEQKAQPQYAAYWKKRTRFYQSLTTRVMKFRENKKESYTKKWSTSVQSIPEEVITMIEVPISPEKSESSTTAEEELDTATVNDPHVRMGPIVGRVGFTTVTTPPLDCQVDPMTSIAESLTAPSKITTSNQISPAKDDEIETARKKMEAFLAKKSDLGKKSFVVTSSNNSTRISDPVKAVDLIGADEQPSNPFPRKVEVVTATLTLTALPVDEQDNNVLQSSVNTNTSQISPAKYDEIEAARKRMEAYIAGKAKGKVNAGPTAQCTKGMVNRATEQATGESKSRFQVTSKQFAVTKPSNSVAPPSSAFPHENVPLASSITPKTKSEISPAKGDEVAAAEERMKKFLEEKAKKQGSVASGLFSVKPTLDGKLVTTAVHGNATASSAVASINSETTLVAEPQIKVVKQISPAKASELAEAQKRMEAFLAKKKESGSVGKKILYVSAVPLIARQADEKTPEKKDKKIRVMKSQTSLGTNRIDPISEQVKSKDGVKTATSKCKEISPAKADEIAEAKKRMEAFLVNKQYGKPVTRTITVSSTSNNVPAEQKRFVVESTQMKKDEQLKLVASNPSDFKTPQKPADGVECSQPKTPFIHSQSVCSDELTSALSDFQVEQVKNPEATRTVPETITGDYAINCFFSGVTVMVERPQLSKVESSDHETPEKSQVPAEDIVKVHYTDDFKKRISTPTKFIASQMIEKCEESPYSSPIKPEPTPEPVMNVTNVISHTPSSVNWLEAQMANLFGRQISMANSVPVVKQVVAPVVKQIPINLSHTICSNELTTALNEIWIKHNNEMLSRQNASMTIKEPDFLKSCVANPDRLLDKVPEYFSPVKTPCQTPVKMQFDKRIRPAVYQFSHKDVLRVRAIKLPFPKRIKKSVSFLDDFKSIPRQPTFDEVANGGGSGFRILSIEDHNANTVTFPKYVPPEGFIPNSK